MGRACCADTGITATQRKESSSRPRSGVNARRADIEWPSLIMRESVEGWKTRGRSRCTRARRWSQAEDTLRSVRWPYSGVASTGSARFAPAGTSPSASTSWSHMPRLVARSAIVLTLAATLASSAPLAAQQRVVGLDVAGMDTTVRPGNDFYRYANGGWDRTTSIPADRSSLTSFAVTAQRARAQLTSLIESYAAAGRVGGDRQRIGDFYTAYLDTVRLARRGMTPIRPLLDSIARIDDRTALARFFGAHLRADVDVLNLGAMQTENLFGLWVDSDFNHPTRTAAVLLQGGAALPDRSYYLDS